MNIYFVCCNVPIEKEALKQVKPEKLLVSYHYFKNKTLAGLTEELGYEPEIVVDSGAYSAYTKGKNIALPDYLNWIDRNPEGSEYINLDVIGNPNMSKRYWEIAREEGYNLMPVYHYNSDIQYLDYYAQYTDRIALGNTVPVKDKNKVAMWVNDITQRYPHVKFHLLGSSSKKVTQGTSLYSVDSSTWIMMAVNGKPKEIPGMTRPAKIERAKYHLNKIMEECKS